MRGSEDECVLDEGGQLVVSHLVGDGSPTIAHLAEHIDWVQVAVLVSLVLKLANLDATVVLCSKDVSKGVETAVLAQEHVGAAKPQTLDVRTICIVVCTSVGISESAKTLELTLLLLEFCECVVGNDAGSSHCELL